MITFSTLIDLLKKSKSFKRKNGNLINELYASISNYITKDEEGKNRNLDEKELTNIKEIFDTASNVIHGKRYDTNQIFFGSKPFFEILMKFYPQENKELGD